LVGATRFELATLAPHVRLHQNGDNGEKASDKALCGQPPCHPADGSIEFLTQEFIELKPNLEDPAYVINTLKKKSTQRESKNK
jgi:hypothetical protein